MKLCKICEEKPIASNGYCRDCDPRPVLTRKYHDPNMSPYMCVGWQTEEKLPDGRTATIVHRLSNYEPG